MRAQMCILYSNKSNNDSERIGKGAAMSYFSTYHKSKTTTKPSQGNQLRDKKCTWELPHVQQNRL